MKKMLYLALMVLLLNGCVSFNNAMTPSPVAFADPFDGKMRVVQQPVSAASSLSEDWHTLGFEWCDDNPNVIGLTVGVSYFKAIQGLAFNIDGVIYQFDSLMGATAYSHNDYVNITGVEARSVQKFVIALEDFKRIASGNDVKMKVIYSTDYSISSFGHKNSLAIVNSKFTPFLNLVESPLL